MLTALFWQIPHVHLYSSGKNKDEPCRGWHWPPDVISQLKEETFVCVYLKHCKQELLLCACLTDSVQLCHCVSEGMSCSIYHTRQLFYWNFLTLLGSSRLGFWLIPSVDSHISAPNSIYFLWTHSSCQFESLKRQVSDAAEKYLQLANVHIGIKASWVSLRNVLKTVRERDLFLDRQVIV